MGEQADHCAVCADVLRFVACGPCGHREACHTCIARLRFVCKDTRCIICKQVSLSMRLALLLQRRLQ